MCPCTVAAGKYGSSAKGTPRAEGYANSLIPLRCRGTTDDIGKAALFLLSDLASYVNGTTLDVDGGLLAANLFPMGLPASNG